MTAPVPHPLAAPAAPHTASIELRGVEFAYGDRAVLKGVSLDVEEGEILAIMGGSGSGKTTLLKLVLGLLRPDGGRVRLLGHDLGRLGFRALQELRTRMGVAFQSGALLSSLSVGDNVALPLREHTRLDETTIGIVTRLKLEAVGLAGAERLAPSELSGGMLKRAALARAIALDPTLLFCDEPSAGLDPVAASGVDDLILRLRDALGMTVVLVTHDMQSAFKIADRICVLDAGEVLAVDRPEAVARHPSARIQNLLHRRTEEEEVDPDVYLRRLLGDTAKP